MSITKSAREMFAKVRAALDNEPHDRYLFTVAAGRRQLQLVVRYLGRRMTYVVSVHERKDDLEDMKAEPKYEQTFGQEFKRYDQAMKEFKKQYNKEE